MPPSPAPGNAGRGGEDKPHAPVSRAGAFVAKLRTLFSVVRCPWLKILSISLKRFSLKCARRCQRISFDDFIAACQRPLRRSIRVNTLED